MSGLSSPLPSTSGGSPSNGDRPVVAIGGGHGLARTLSAMRICGWRPTAIVSVADDGGSSGRLRREMDVSPPGDLRRALSTLCPDPVRRRLLEYRFEAGELAGHALGNLVLLGGAALRDGDMTAGLALLGDLFDAHGRVVPVCETAVDLEATLADGSVVHGQKRLTATPGIRQVRLVSGDEPASPLALDAIAAAELVVIGPGSLFTSLVPPLLAAGMAQALRTTDATTVVVANIRQQRGETEDMDLQGHVDALFRHLPEDMGIDVVVCNDAAATDDDVTALRAPVSHPGVGLTIAAPLSDAGGAHDPELLATVLRDL